MSNRPTFPRNQGTSGSRLSATADFMDVQKEPVSAARRLPHARRAGVGQRVVCVWTANSAGHPSFLYFPCPIGRRFHGTRELRVVACRQQLTSWMSRKSRKRCQKASTCLVSGSGPEGGLRLDGQQFWTSIISPLSMSNRPTFPRNRGTSGSRLSATADFMDVQKEPICSSSRRAVPGSGLRLDG